MENLERLSAGNQLIAALITNQWDGLSSHAIQAVTIKQIRQRISEGHRIMSAQMLYSLGGIAISFHMVTASADVLHYEDLILALTFQNGKISTADSYYSHAEPLDIPTSEMLKIGDQFLTALKTRDWTMMRSILASDASWTLPGTSLLSGMATGDEAVINRAKQLRNFGVSVQLKSILYGRNGIILSLHNTATRGALLLDEQVAIACEVNNGKIYKITTHLSDVEGINAFFVDGII